MRKTLMISAALIALAAAGCGNNHPDPAEAAAPEPTAPATSEPTTQLISITIEADSGLVGHNYDDDLCVFAEPEYELRDGTGAILDVGQWEDGGASVGPSEWAAVGHVESLDPYKCVMYQPLTAPVADIYSLTVTVQEAPLLGFDPDMQDATGEATFRRDQAGDVTVEIIENR